MEDLLPCPMCGCKATFVKHSAGMPGTQGFDKWDAVACKHCRTTVGACDRRFRCRADAAEAWNRRVLQASLLAKEAECEALRVKAARYDWLRRWDTNLDGVLLCKTSDGNYWRHGPGLDAAIDAARAAADQGGAS